MLVIQILMRPVDLYVLIEKSHNNDIISDLQYNKLSKSEQDKYRIMTKKEFYNHLSKLQIPGTLKSEIFHSR